MIILGITGSVGMGKTEAGKCFIKNNIDVFDETIVKHLHKILKTSKFDIILFGTGENLKKIPEKLKKYLIEQKHNFEIMSTNSAFNTHNVLLSENRNLVSIIKLI